MLISLQIFLSGKNILNILIMILMWNKNPKRKNIKEST